MKHAALILLTVSAVLMTSLILFVMFIIPIFVPLDAATASFWGAFLGAPMTVAGVVLGVHLTEEWQIRRDRREALRRLLPIALATRIEIQAFQSRFRELRRFLFVTNGEVRAVAPLEAARAIREATRWIRRYSLLQRTPIELFALGDEVSKALTGYKEWAFRLPSMAEWMSDENRSGTNRAWQLAGERKFTFDLHFHFERRARRSMPSSNRTALICNPCDF